MVRVNIKAVVLGFLATIALDTLVSVVLLVVFGGDIEIKSEQQIKEAYRGAISNAAFLWLSFILGALTTVVGAYLAARIAKRYPYFNGLALGVVGVAWSLLLWSSDFPLWFNVPALVLVVPTALVGAWIFVRLSRRRAS